VNFEVMHDKIFQNFYISESQTKSSLQLKMVLKPFGTEEALEAWLRQFAWA